MRLSPLRFLILDILSDGNWRTAGTICRDLAKIGYARTLPSFYSLLNRIEVSGFIESHREKHDEQDATKSVQYRITLKGCQTWEQSKYLDEGG